MVNEGRNDIVLRADSGCFRFILDASGLFWMLRIYFGSEFYFRFKWETIHWEFGCFLNLGDMTAIGIGCGII